MVPREAIGTIAVESRVYRSQVGQKRRGFRGQYEEPESYLLLACWCCRGRSAGANKAAAASMAAPVSGHRSGLIGMSTGTMSYITTASWIHGSVSYT
jgi:hypothetical protein